MEKLLRMPPQPDASPVAKPSGRLRQNGLLFHSLFMNAPSATVVIDEDGAIVLANRQAEAMFDFAVEDMVGRAIDELVPTPRGASCAWYRPLRRELKALGTRLIVDDFGAGYSSFSALRDLGIDGLKLDRSFVQALEHGDDDEAMMKAVLSLADAIGADVTAEGVETRAQVSSLRAHGCDYAQGYLFARPAPAAELTALIASQSGQFARASA
jgi:hypothetical protein